MGIVRKVKRNALAKAIKERDLQLQSQGFKANQGRVNPEFLVKKGVTFIKPKTINVDIEI